MQRIERMRETCAQIRARTELCSRFAEKDAVRMDDGKRGEVTKIIATTGTLEIKLTGSRKVDRYAASVVHKL
ncbi:MAG TPA: hypothetical protein VFY28_02840 [Candidatus Paceibacterota bacterium]|nr:hypothetical protein [Candidatus Paceibacterota bacterium]